MYLDVARALITLSLAGVPVGKGVSTREILTSLSLPFDGPHIARVGKALRGMGWRSVRMGGLHRKKLRGARTAWYPTSSFDWRDSLPT